MLTFIQLAGICRSESQFVRYVGEVVPSYTVKVYGGVKLYPYCFPTLALDGGEGLHPGQNLGTHSYSDGGEKRERIASLPENSAVN